MENDNSSALTPMAGKVSKLQEDCASKRCKRRFGLLRRWRLPQSAPLQFILAPG